MLKLALLLLVSAVLSLSCAARPDDAALVGAMCFSQSDCGYGEICVKAHDYDPNGRCIKGAF